MNRRLIKLYVQKYAKGVIDFEGIKILLSYVEDDSTPVKLRIENPNNISYSRDAIEGAYYLSYKSFYELLGENLYPYQVFRDLMRLTEMDDELEDFYISNKDKTKIENILKKIETFDVSYKNYYDCTIDVDFISFDISVYGEEVNLSTKFKVQKIYNNITKQEENYDYMNFIFDEMYKHTGIPEEINNFLSPAVFYIYSTPIVDRQNGYVVSDASFFSPNGNKII